MKAAVHTKYKQVEWKEVENPAENIKILLDFNTTE